MTDLVTVYFGRPGNLETIRLPRGGITATPTRPAATYALASGGVAADKLLHGRRQYTLSYQALSVADFEQMAAYQEGHNGPGPFVLLDPGQRNMLYRNQSAATAFTNDTSNFTVAGSGCTIASETTTVHGVRPRSLKWTFASAAPASAALSLVDPVPEWPGIPCASRQHSFGFFALGGGADAIVGLQPKLTYLDVGGATLGSDTAGVVSTNGSTWTLFQVNGGTPPAGTAYLNASVAASAATIGAGAVVYCSEFMCNEGTTLDTPWTPGTGIYPVMPVTLPDQQPGLFTNYRTSPVFVLQETGGA